jgi:hypothetical protein
MDIRGFPLLEPVSRVQGEETNGSYKKGSEEIRKEGSEKVDRQEI